MAGTLQATFMNQRSFGPPPPGAIGSAYEGGFYAGQIGVGGVATHYLVVAPYATGQSNLQWKTSASATTGTQSDIDGPTNSNNMNNASHPAAQFCKGLTIGGYSDWYMPARNELEVQYYFLKPTAVNNKTTFGSNPNAVSPQPVSTNYTLESPAQTSATNFQSGGAEAFDAATYWSSTENPSITYTAFRKNFYYGGGEYFANKSGARRVRAVRRIPV
jgi:hypothetical protein